MFYCMENICKASVCAGHEVLGALSSYTLFKTWIITLIRTVVNTGRFHNMRSRLYTQMNILRCCVACSDPTCQEATGQTLLHKNGPLFT